MLTETIVSFVAQTFFGAQANSFFRLRPPARSACFGPPDRGCAEMDATPNRFWSDERPPKALDDAIDLDALPKWLRDPIGGDAAQRRKDERFGSALLIALRRPAYWTLYRDAISAVEDTEQAANRAVAKRAIERGFAEDHCNALRSGAATTPDGRRVYAGPHFSLIAEDGDDVTAERVKVRGLSPHMPTWDEYREARRRVAEIERRQKALRQYREETLDPFKRRLSDPDHPCSKDALNEMRKDIWEKSPPEIAAELHPRAADAAHAPLKAVASIDAAGAALHRPGPGPDKKT